MAKCKRIFKKSFAKRKVNLDTATAKVEELDQQLRLTTVATQIEIAKEQAEPYFRVRDAFAALCKCDAIWNIKLHQSADRFHERTTIEGRVGLERVRFALDSCDLIQWEQKVAHLQNATDGDLFLYPGFILYRVADETFSVIDFHDVKIVADSIRFHEPEKVPKDSKVIGQTWAKANKDGGRDKRFANNFQIPVVQYASLLCFKSEHGLCEEFHFSNPERLDRFVKEWNAFVSSFGTQAQQTV